MCFFFECTFHPSSSMKRKQLDDGEHTAWHRHELKRRAWVAQTTLPTAMVPLPEDMETLEVLRPTEKGRIMLFGKIVECPRFNQAYGSKGYNFSGMAHPPLAMPPLVQRYLDYANECCSEWLDSPAYEGRRFNMAFINWYPDGGSSIGWHSDDETQLYHTSGGETLVFSLSLGATRRFLVREKVRPQAAVKKDPAAGKQKKVPVEMLGLALAHNSVLVMGGLCQQHYQHSVPKTAKDVGARINLTFRIFK